MVRVSPFDVFRGRLEVAYQRRNCEMAHAIIDDVFSRRSDPLEVPVQDRIKAPIATLFGDDTRIIAKLARLNIETIEDLLNTSDVRLLESKNFGGGTLQRVHDALRRAGLDRRQLSRQPARTR